MRPNLLIHPKLSQDKVPAMESWINDILRIPKGKCFTSTNLVLPHVPPPYLTFKTFVS